MFFVIVEEVWKVITKISDQHSIFLKRAEKLFARFCFFLSIYKLFSHYGYTFGSTLTG